MIILQRPDTGRRIWAGAHSQGEVLGLDHAPGSSWCVASWLFSLGLLVRLLVNHPPVAPAQTPSSFAFHHAKPPLRRPRLDDQQRRLRVQPGGDDLGNVGKKQITGMLFADRSGENRPPGDLRLARPLGLLTPSG